MVLWLLGPSKIPESVTTAAATPMSKFPATKENRAGRVFEEPFRKSAQWP